MWYRYFYPLDEDGQRYRLDKERRYATGIGNPTPRMLKACNVRLSEFFEKPEKSVLFRHCARHRLD